MLNESQSVIFNKEEGIKRHDDGRGLFFLVQFLFFFDEN